jgi:SAM-dependent methyltransferase
MTHIDPIQYGNYYDKYRSRNPVTRWLTNGFLEGWGDLVSIVLHRGRPESLLETGCGDGFLLEYTQRRLNPSRITVGLEPGILEIRNTFGIPGTFVKVSGSIYDMPFDDDAFDIVTVPEVFEHLEDPERALREVIRVASGYVIASVPWEPVWRIMNLLRFKYVKDIGNTPGHLRHFTRRGFIDFMRQAVDISHVRTPFPWTMVLGSVRKNKHNLSVGDGKRRTLH